jgi:hypothetical protein
MQRIGSDDYYLTEQDEDIVRERLERSVVRKPTAFPAPVATAASPASGRSAALPPARAAGRDDRLPLVA